MSGIIKSVRKAIRTVGSGAKKIIKGVKKVFKKVASSTIGKVILAALVIYTGGVVMGAWGSTGPMSGIYGAWGGGVATSAGGVTSAAAGAGGVPSGASALSSVASAMPAATQAGGAGLIAAETAATVGTGIGAVQQPAQGFLASAGETLTGAADWMEKHKLATAIGFKGLSSALSPDEEDLIRMQEESRKRRWSSLEGLSDMNFGVRPGRSTLLDSSGRPWHERLRGGG